MVRLFTAIALPPDVSEALVRRQKGLPGARWRPVENLHVTLAFYGEMPEPQADDLAAELSRVFVEPFALTVTGAGSFGDGWRSRTLWAGVQADPGLAILAGRCNAAGRRAGLTPESRDYRPHVTLASIRLAEDDRVAAWLKGHARLALEPFRVDRFGLYSSVVTEHGSHYTLERGYPL